MAREPEGYREALEELNRLYPDVGMLTIREAGQAIRKKDPRAIKRALGITGTTVTKDLVARGMCRLECRQGRRPAC